MTICYGRSFLLSARYWWKDLARNIKPVVPTQWNELKSNGILRSYRGKRSGAHSKLRENHVEANTTFVPDFLKSKADVETAKKQPQRKLMVSLLNMQTDTSAISPTIELDSVTCSQGRRQFVPSVLLSNTMSLAPKLDEIGVTVDTTPADICLFTETWLNESVPDKSLNLNGFQLFRRDRVGWEHGGVCMYVRNSIQCNILSDLRNDDHEALWVDTKPRRLPRNFSNIIVGVIYHPPSANDNTMKEYLLSSLESLESKFPNCAIILAGDFNRTLLPILERAFRPFHLNPVVTFPTRGDRTLDQIFTNISSFYAYPSRMPPFGLSDHHSVLIEANVRDKSLKPQHKTIKARDKRPSKRASLGRFLLQVPWSELLSAEQTCEQKLQTLTDVLNYGLNTIMPERSIRVHETDRPWISVQLKDLIARRQQALASGNRMLYKILRNKVNRERKRCRKTYYANKIGDLHNTNPRDWWREVKQICGTTKTTRRDLTSMLHQDLICEEPVLADNINRAFVNIMKDYQPLTDSVRVSVEDDEPLTVTEELVEKKLRAISTSRASGPDELPNWNVVCPVFGK
ncbi:uncharacterized protein [Montipora foliosa]|uniref:uncharacterized protein n=1 Tax=Montipora foliosa TaxID=591990 RepID=UPI0035F1D658